MRDRVDFFGVTAGHRHPVAALNIVLEFIVAP
jgi:hypothetical protein